MAEADVKQTKRYFNFLFEFKDSVVLFYSRQKERTENALGKVYEVFNPVISFFAFFYRLFWSIVYGVKQIYLTVTSSVHNVVQFDYKEFLISLSHRPHEYYSYAKEKLYKIVGIPIKRHIFRVKKVARKKIYEVKVYFLGFCELCRRLFLLASDFTPGGRWTVSLLLLIAAMFVLVETYRYSGVVFKLLDLLWSLAMFVMTPVLWTVRDIWKVLGFGVDVLLSLLQYICYLLWLCIQGLFDFMFRVIAAFSSAIFRCIVWILNLRLIKLIWQSILKLTLIWLEFFIFKVVPFMAVVFTYVADFSAILGAYFYKYFVAVYDDGSHKTYWSNTRMFALVMTILSVLIAYRYRKRFAVVAHLDQDLRMSLRRSMRKTLRDAKSEDEVDKVHFKVSSSAHICMGFLRGECTEGRRCESHHCQWPYHWQYRIPVQGWQSFNQQDSNAIEKLYCNPLNEISKTIDINPDLSAMTRRSHVKTNNSIKLDFQQMRMEVSYHRLELRRLSTESCANNSDELATTWIWYRLTDDGKWNEYDNVELPRQVDIEKGFLKRESTYIYKKEDQEYRIYFFMTPMYEKSRNPREYRRRLVRRRPVYRSLDDM